jgi:hypothetical protein
LTTKVTRMRAGWNTPSAPFCGNWRFPIRTVRGPPPRPSMASGPQNKVLEVERALLGARRMAVAIPMPKISMPKISMPKISMPKISMAQNHR